MKFMPASPMPCELRKKLCFSFKHEVSLSVCVSDSVKQVCRQFKMTLGRLLSLMNSLLHVSWELARMVVAEWQPHLTCRGIFCRNLLICYAIICQRQWIKSRRNWVDGSSPNTKQTELSKYHEISRDLVGRVNVVVCSKNEFAIFIHVASLTVTKHP